jgi:hypothetical protein
MRTFKQFLIEAEVNFDTSDISPEAKKAGRATIAKIAEFPPATVQKMQAFIGKKATSPDQMMKVFNAFVDAFPKEARIISTNRNQQVGPGELVFYYVFDNIGVGGNQNIDLFLNGKPFAEVKAGDVMTRRGEKCVEKFELSPGNHPAVRKILKAFKDFNEAYKDENDGDDLPGWESEDHVNISPLFKWRDLSLSGSGGMDLTLKTSGDLLKKGEDDPVLNVNKAKSVAPLKKLLDEPAEAADINDAIDDWAETIGDTYVKDKLFFLLDNSKMRCVYAGNITSDNLDLMAIWRGRPIARVYPDGKPKGKTTETKA